MRKLLPMAVLVISLVLLLVGCSVFKTDGGDKSQAEIYVKFDGGSITKGDFTKFITSLPNEQQEALNMAGQQVKLLNSMANEEAFYAKAKDLGYDKDPEVISLIESRLKPFYIQEFYALNIKDKASVSDNEVKKYYDENPDFFTEPAKATIRYIQAKDMDSAQDIMKDLTEKELQFSVVSSVKSINTYAKGNDGIIREVTNDGYIQGIGYDALLDSLIFSLPVDEDEIYGPYQSETGIHIFTILNRQDAYVKPFEEVKDLANSRALALKQKAISDQLIEKVKEDKNIKVANEVLEKIDFVDTSNNSQEILDKAVLTSKIDEFSWTAKDLIDNYNSINKNERMFIAQNSPQEILDHLLSKEVYYYQLKKDGLDKELNKTDKFNRNIRNIILSYTYQKLVVDKVNITDEMVEDYYNANKLEFSKPAYRNIELLVFENTDNAEDARLQYISAVNNEDTAEIERIMNEYASNDFDKRLINNVYSNGIIPGYGKDTILNTAIWNLPVNEVSDILTLKKDDKAAIFRVVHEEAIQYKPLNHVEPQIEGKLKRAESAQLFESLLEEFKDEFNFEIYEDKLRPTLNAEELFELAERQAKVGKYNDTVLYYDQIISAFPNGKDDYKAMFMKGFTQSEYMNDKQSAIQTFSKFLQKYPEGELNADAQVMLDILTGKTSIEIPDDLELQD